VYIYILQNGIPDMIRLHKLTDNQTIAELSDDSFVLRNAEDAIELINTPEAQECTRFIIYERNLSNDFFSLGSGVAGDILQKFSNYRLRLAVIGDFSKFKSKNLNDFFRESNKTGNIIFVNTLEEALDRFNATCNSNRL
jgi:hypothetical protein